MCFVRSVQLACFLLRNDSCLCLQFRKLCRLRYAGDEAFLSSGHWSLFLQLHPFRGVMPTKELTPTKEMNKFPNTS